MVAMLLTLAFTAAAPAAALTAVEESLRLRVEALRDNGAIGVAGLRVDGDPRLVDLYELLRFDVVCADDDDKHNERVRFFLYHSSEKKLRGPGGTVEIETTGEVPFRIPLASLLDLLHVEYTENSSLGDLETELWQAMFADPNDAFDPADYCHSPWYERCCREERTVGSLKEKGDWDELWLKMRPRKSVNPPPVAVPPGGDQIRFPRGVVVEHHDFDTLSLTLKEQILPPPGEDGDAGEPRPLCLMVLLKV